jgi:hypothetical protein
MAFVRPEEVIEDLSTVMRFALEDAVRQTLPNVQVNIDTLFQTFKTCVGARCSQWEQVNDSHVRI